MAEVTWHVCMDCIMNYSKWHKITVDSLGEEPGWGQWALFTFAPYCLQPQVGKTERLGMVKELRGKITRDASVVCLAFVAGFGQDLKLSASG